MRKVSDPGLAIILVMGFLFLSGAIAISMESPEGMQAVITLLTMPFFFTSNALYPVDSFPPLLRALSTINPLTHLVSGIRYFSWAEKMRPGLGFRQRHKSPGTCGQKKMSMIRPPAASTAAFILE